MTQFTDKVIQEVVEYDRKVEKARTKLVDRLFKMKDQVKSNLHSTTEARKGLEAQEKQLADDLIYLESTMTVTLEEK